MIPLRFWHWRRRIINKLNPLSYIYFVVVAVNNEGGNFITDENFITASIEKTGRHRLCYLHSVVVAIEIVTVFLKIKTPLALYLPFYLLLSFSHSCC